MTRSRFSNAITFRDALLAVVFTLGFGCLPVFQQNLFAQGEDLTLPGDEAPVVVNTSTAADDGADMSVGQESESLIQMLLDGGWAMIPLVTMLFVVVALSAYMFLDLKRSTFLPPALVSSLNSSAETGDLSGLIDQSKRSTSCLGAVMHGACEYIDDRGYQVLDSDSIFDQMADASQEFNRKRVSLLNYLSVISQAAPMVGLLGTVSGMIKAFATLKQSGMGDPGQLAGNISEALVTTASGLVVALPAIFAFFFFRDKLVAHVSSVDRQCGKTLNTLRKVVIGKSPASASSSSPPPVPPQQQQQQQQPPAQQQPQPTPPAQQQQPVPPAATNDPTPVPPATGGPTPVPPAQQPHPPADQS